MQSVAFKLFQSKCSFVSRASRSQVSVGFYSLQTCLDIIQASADPSASLPRAKRSLPRTSAAHVFHCLLPQAFRGAWFTRFASASIGAERKVILSDVAFRRSLCRLGLHWATHATWPLACKHGATLPRRFRKASANLPRNTRLFLPSWLAVGICSSSKRCVSCMQQHLFFYWNRFSELFYARTETFSCTSATKLPQTFREQIPSASLPHASARLARRTFSIIMSPSPLN